MDTDSINWIANPRNRIRAKKFRIRNTEKAFNPDHYRVPYLITILVEGEFFHPNLKPFVISFTM